MDVPVTEASRAGSPTHTPLPAPRRGGRQNLGISAVMLALVCLLGYSVSRNKRFQWHTVGQYVGAHTVLKGLGLTLWLTFVVMALGMVGGAVVALLRRSRHPAIARAAWAFTWFFRSVPMLVQILFWFNLAALYPTLSLGVPAGPTFVHASTNSVITPFVAVIIGFALHESAYMAEIIRTGLSSVPNGQWLAGRSIGMTEGKLLRRVVLPQVIRVIIPTLGNEAISVMKETSLVSVIAVTDLLYSVQLIYGSNFQTIPLLIVATIWYLVVTIALGGLQHLLERHFGRSLRSLPTRRTDGELRP